MPTINALNVTLIAISRSPLGSPTARRSTLFAGHARVARSCAAELRRARLALAVVTRGHARALFRNYEWKGAKFAD